MRITTTINGTEYELATNLRVAFNVQGCNNHKPYAEVFKGLGDMPLEKQIEVLFEAFKVANPEVAATFNKQAFQTYYLDNYNLKQMMKQLEGVMKGIMGEDEEPETSGN